MKEITRLMALCLGVGALLANDAPQAVAQSDSTPPTLTGFSLNPTTLDVRNGPAVLKLTVGVQDAPSGFRNAVAWILGPSGQVGPQLIFWSNALISGTVNDGSFQGQTTFPEFAEGGTWRVEELRVFDNIGNEAFFTRDQLRSQGFVPDFTVESVSDAQAPVLTSFTLNPTTVDVRNGPAVLKLTVGVQDAPSGFRNAVAWILGPSGQVGPQLIFWSNALISGTVNDGSFQGQTTFPEFAEGGTWRVEELRVFDNIGNEAFFTRDQLRSQGFVPDFTVESVSDAQAPVLTSFTLNPTTVDVRNGPATIALTVSVTDAPAGFLVATGYIEGPSGQAGPQLILWSDALVSGNSNDGVFRGQFQMPEFAEIGTWRLLELRLLDRANNSVVITRNELQSRGHVTDVNVTEIECHPPTIASLSPASVCANSEGITLSISGSGFQQGATLLWNTEWQIATDSVDESQVTAWIPAELLATSGLITVVTVEVVNPSGEHSNPAAFTLTDGEVAVADSKLVGGGSTATVSSLTSEAVFAGVQASLETSGVESTRSVTAATYSSNPASGSFFDVGGGFVDLQVTGAMPGDSMTAVFYYPSIITGEVEDNLVLLHYDGSAWVPTLSSGGSAPLKDTEDGGFFGGVFTVLIDDTSTPKITELSGTVFATTTPFEFTGFLPPIGGADETGGSFWAPLRTYKLKSTIPVKFEATLNGAPVLDGIHRLQVVKHSETAADPPIDATSRDAATEGNRFRRSGTEWHFNLDTKATGMTVGVWELRALLADGTQRSAWIQLR